MTERPPRASRLRFWPWLVLALTTIPSVWYVFDYEDDIDPELPRVVRPTFSRYPPPAYRFAEACDTIDHSAVYVSSAALVLAAWGWLRKPRERMWAAALALSAAAFWHAATPAPLADGWYGLGWRTIFDPRAPAANRLILAVLAAGVVTLVVRALLERPIRSAWNTARARGILGLLIAAAILMIMRQIGWLDPEPFGFWPRWFYVWGLFAWAFALVKIVPPAPARWPRALIVGFMVLISLGLDFTGRGLFWYQRPIAHLREMEPGRLYLSAMPTYLGLQLTQERYHFRTIIDLYPEYTSEQSPHWQDEMRFSREHDLNYVFNESHDGTAGDDFIAQTLELARQPENWPVLVHCHASMDRSPAWVGIYRFVLQDWPLIDVLREIERHRGLRPKAAVTVLYAHLLPKMAPERCAQDPTFALLKKCAAGADGPEAQVALRSAREWAGSERSPQEMTPRKPGRSASMTVWKFADGRSRRGFISRNRGGHIMVSARLLGFVICVVVAAIGTAGETLGAPPAFAGSRAGEEREIAGVKLCWCPPGQFTMGSPPRARAPPGEVQVKVTLSKGFWTAKYEITQGLWTRIMGKLPGPLTAELPEGDDYPVGNVNFAETEAFCAKLTELAHRSGELPDGWEFRLPTEAQWEYACRAGTATATSFGDKLSSNQANFKGKPYNGGERGPSLGKAAKVGSYPANPWGLHDMHGNTYEWCRDWYHAKLPGGVDPDLRDARKTSSKSQNGAVSRVRRGGCWADEGWPCRSAFRLRFEPDRRYDHIGFRVVAVKKD